MKTCPIKGYFDIALILIVSILLLLVIFLFPIGVIQITLGLIFVLISPGYLLLTCLFPRNIDLSSIERVVLSCGLSMAIVPLIGLILNFLPWGLGLIPVLVALMAYVSIMAVFAAVIRHMTSIDERFTGFRLSGHPNKIASVVVAVNKTSFANILLTTLLIVLVLGAAGLLIYIISIPRNSEKYSEFYVLDSDNVTLNYPQQVKMDESPSITLGIVNHENEKMAYKYMITEDNVTISTNTSIVLENEQKWEKVIFIKPVIVGENQKIEFTLYKNDATDPYIKLHIWVNVSK